MLDRYDCYQLCVQSPRHLTALLEALCPGATVLREDFCGTGAVSVRWVEDGRRRGERRRAIAVDLDPEPMEKGRRQAQEANVDREIQWRCEDVLGFAGGGGGAKEGAGSPTKQGRKAVDAGGTPVPRGGVERQEPCDSADIVFVGNFSIGYIHERRVLVEYFRACAERLRRGHGGFGGGVLACDTYGGATSYVLGGFERKHPSQGREMIRYYWSHDAADPLTGMVENSISFRVEIDGEIVQELPRAFVYRWRLWSIPEVRDAMREAGFASTEVYHDANVAPGERAEEASAEKMGEDWIVLVAGRV